MEGFDYSTLHAADCVGHVAYRVVFVADRVVHAADSAGSDSPCYSPSSRLEDFNYVASLLTAYVLLLICLNLRTDLGVAYPSS